MKQRGFTLIELAIVLAIIGILASVAIPKFMNLTETSEAGIAKDGREKLTSAKTIYIGKKTEAPKAFADFVAIAPLAADSDQTISLFNFGPNSTKPGGGKCQIMSDTEINCNAAFNAITLSYRLDPTTDTLTACVKGKKTGKVYENAGCADIAPVAPAPKKP